MIVPSTYRSFGDNRVGSPALINHVHIHKGFKVPLPKLPGVSMCMSVSRSPALYSMDPLCFPSLFPDFPKVPFLLGVDTVFTGPFLL